MIVFKNYFNIVKKHLGTIIMFSSICIGISVINTSYNNSEKFTSINPKISIINYDNSSLSNNFINYIDEKAEIIEIKDNEKEIQDALYTNKVDSILIIPENFTTELLKGNHPLIKIKKSIQNTSEYVQTLVNRYFKVANIYSSMGLNEDEIIKNIDKSLANEIEVKFQNSKKNNLDKLAIFYSFENYAFLSIFIFIIGTIMCIFNKETIRKRNNISKLNSKSFSKQLFLGHITLTLSLWAIFVLISFILYKDIMFNINGLLLIINSLVFTITITSLAYLIGSFIKNQNIISGIQNVVALGLSFISGCFVPIEFLDQNIVNFSKLFPSYWFINGNYEIVKITNLNFESFKPILINWGIILLFGVVYFIFSHFINKRNK